jgi:hypothetical protein
MKTNYSVPNLVSTITPISLRNGVGRIPPAHTMMAVAATPSKMDTPVKKIQERSYFQGGISSRYYYGQTDLESTYQYNGTSQTSTYSLKDQSSLISNVDATQRIGQVHFLL